MAVFQRFFRNIIPQLPNNNNDGVFLEQPQLHLINRLITIITDLVIVLSGQKFLHGNYVLFYVVFKFVFAVLFVVSINIFSLWSKFWSKSNFDSIYIIYIFFVCLWDRVQHTNRHTNIASYRLNRQKGLWGKVCLMLNIPFIFVSGTVRSILSFVMLIQTTSSKGQITKINIDLLLKIEWFSDTLAVLELGLLFNQFCFQQQF